MENGFVERDREVSDSSLDKVGYVYSSSKFRSFSGFDLGFFPDSRAWKALNYSNIAKGGLKIFAFHFWQKDTIPRLSFHFILQLGWAWRFFQFWLPLRTVYCVKKKNPPGFAIWCENYFFGAKSGQLCIIWSIVTFFSTLSLCSAWMPRNEGKEMLLLVF